MTYPVLIRKHVNTGHVMEFDQSQYWLEHAESGQRKMEVAQKELRRLHPELFENVVFLEEYKKEEPDVA